MKHNELLKLIESLFTCRVRSTILAWYIFSLMIRTKKHTLSFASEISSISCSQFSRMLKNATNITAITLEEFSKKTASVLIEKLESLVEGRWSIAIIVDSTILTRSSLHPENSKRFNHGSGFVIGQQWTNIILVINGVIIPLKPIPFYSKNYCKKLGIEYQTEPNRLIQYLDELDLTRYIGPHDSKKILFLADSGYDNRNIQKTIQAKGWSFIIDLKSTRSVKSMKTKGETWCGVKEFFKNQRCLSWKSIRIYKMQNNKKKREDFRVREAIVFLRHCFKVKLVCSERRKRPDGRRKYLACNDLNATSRDIIIGYRLRWVIEIFHKLTKMHLGFEDVACKSFTSVTNHVHCVYIAFLSCINISDIYGLGKNAISETQKIAKRALDSKSDLKMIHDLTKINGREKVKERIRSVYRGDTDLKSRLKEVFRMNL